MSNLSLNANFVSNSAYINKIGQFASKKVSFKGIQKDEFVRSQNSNDPNVKFQKGNEYYKAGDYQAAIDEFDLGIEILENKEQSGIELSQEEKFLLADMHYLNGSSLSKIADKEGHASYYSYAADEYSRAFELCPHSANSVKLRGISNYNYAIKGNLTGEEFISTIDSAIADFDKALELKFDSNILKNKADCYMAKGDWDKAIETLDEIIGYEESQLSDLKESGSSDTKKMNALNFSIGNSHHLKGTCYRRSGKYDEAYEEYSCALNYVKNSPNTLRVRGRTLYLKALTKNSGDSEKMKLLADSIKDYNAALNMRPDSETYRFKAQSYIKMRDFSSAFDVIQEGIDFVKKEGEIKTGDCRKRQISLANLYATKGDCFLDSATNSHSISYPRATEAYTKAIEIVPDSPNLYYARACANYHVNSEDCIKDIRKAIELDSSRPEYWDYLSKALAYSDNEEELQESMDAMLTAMMLRNKQNS